ncbi:hypothetical protein ABC855_g1176 [[Candida] zeylanoides]
MIKNPIVFVNGNSIVVPPREDPKTFATNVNGSHDEATVIVSGKAPSNRSSGVASPSNFTFIQVDPFDNLDHDDSFQAIRTAIRKSIAGKPKTVSPGVSETPGKVPTVTATSDGVQSSGRKSGPPQKSTLDQSAKLGEFTNPYKTPGKSVKSSMSPSDLPEILTDDEDNKEKRVFEPWAQTPQLKRVLLHQQHLNPDKIFGAIPPMDIEDIFESQASRQRGRASMSNWSPTSK